MFFEFGVYQHTSGQSRGQWLKDSVATKMMAAQKGRSRAMVLIEYHQKPDVDWNEGAARDQVMNICSIFWLFRIGKWLGGNIFGLTRLSLIRSSAVVTLVMPSES